MHAEGVRQSGDRLEVRSRVAIAFEFADRVLRDLALFFEPGLRQMLPQPQRPKVCRFHGSALNA
jgi:hypothetical protein